MARYSITPRADGSTLATTTIDYAHHEIHDGSAFIVAVNNSGGSGTKATVSFTTPAGSKWIHMLAEYRSNVEAFYTVGEGATVGAESGANSPCINRNRNYSASKVSILLPAGSVPATVGNVTLGGTVSDFGTTLQVFHFGSGKTGGGGRDNNEWVLKPSTVYAFQVESQAATSEVSLELHWYEHTDKQ